MSRSVADSPEFFTALQNAVRAQTDKRALTPLLKRWRYTQSSDSAQLPLKAGSARFLRRYGVIDAGKDADAQLKDYHALLLRMSRATGDAPGVVGAWIELFASGEYGVLEKGICAVQPRCEICPLQEKCRYLAAGAKDARLSGENIARDLLLANSKQRPDLRVSDLLAFIMSGEKCGAADTARTEALLKACGGVRGLFLARPETLRELGLNEPQRARLLALAEICRNWAEERTTKGRAFATGKDFYDEYHLRLRDLKKEVFIVVLLDQKNTLISDEQVSEGSLTETLVHPREVFAQAVARRAASVALIHNHPSGDPVPSTADKAITRRLESVSKLMGIRLLDHIIIGDGRFTSFVESGLLNHNGS